MKPAAIADIIRSGEQLEIIGGGSKRGLGRPPIGRKLIVSALAGITDHDPAELVITAHAGTAIAEIEHALAERGQMLAFEPPAWHRLYADGTPTLHPTLGGMVACNLAGPRRIRAGSVRDHLLGFSAVNGRGEIWQSGGRVVKNVSGYDMAKLQCGAMGTLSVLTSLTLRTIPRPPQSCTILIHDLSDRQALTLMIGALNSPWDITAAAHLPPAPAARAGLPGPTTMLRLEGQAPPLHARAAQLRAQLGVIAPSAMMAASMAAGEQAGPLWQKIGAVADLLAPDTQIWRLCPTPAAAADITATLRQTLPEAEFFYDWAGGLIWLSLPHHQAAAALIRATMSSGHATLIRAPDAQRNSTEVFHPLPAPLAALADRVRRAFDPASVLNPGRLKPLAPPETDRP